jgi:hypothetical protein
MDCAAWHPQNVKWNEAISSQSLTSDANIKGQLSDVGSVVAGVNASLVQGHDQIEVVDRDRPKR